MESVSLIAYLCYKKIFPHMFMFRVNHSISYRFILLRVIACVKMSANSLNFELWFVGKLFERLLWQRHAVHFCQLNYNYVDVIAHLLTNPLASAFPSHFKTLPKADHNSDPSAHEPKNTRQQIRSPSRPIAFVAHDRRRRRRQKEERRHQPVIPAALHVRHLERQLNN